MFGLFDGFGNGGIVAAILGFAALWGLQMFLAGKQAQRFMRSVGRLRAAGETAIGRSGSRWRGNVFVALAADATGRVTGARVFRGVTTFASPVPWDAPVGHDLADVAAWDGDGDASSERAAAAQAARFLLGAEDEAGRILAAGDGPGGARRRPRPRPRHLPLTRARGGSGQSADLSIVRPTAGTASG